MDQYGYVNGAPEQQFTSEQSGTDTELMSLMNSLFGHGQTIYGSMQPALQYSNYSTYNNQVPNRFEHGQDPITAPFAEAYGPVADLTSISQPIEHSYPQSTLLYTPNGVNTALPVSQASHPQATSATVNPPQSMLFSDSGDLPGKKRQRSMSFNTTDGAHLASGESEEKPGTTARASKACGECRKAKVRCILNENGGLPCSRCRSTGKDCHFVDSIGRGKVPRRNKSLATQSSSVPWNTSPTAGSVDETIKEVEGPTSATSVQLQSPIQQSAPLEAQLADSVTVQGTRPAKAIDSSLQCLGSPSDPLSDTDADMLFEIFFSSLNVRWALLNKDVHTVSFCKRKSTFLFNTVCFIASCYSIAHTNLRQSFSDAVRAQAMSVRVISVASLESVQAYLLLSLWGTGYGRRDEYDRAWTMICLACRMALDLQLSHASWRGTPHHIAERAWILCCVIDQTKSAQRGRIPSLSRHFDAVVQEAPKWIAEEPECLLLVYYAELLYATQNALNTLMNIVKDSQEIGVTVRAYERQATKWLARFTENGEKLRSGGHLNETVDLYMAYLAEFYVSYWSLAVSSFAFQHALKSQNSAEISHYLTSTTIYATRILKATEIELKRDSPLRVAPDGHFEFILHAAVFLLKITRYGPDEQRTTHDVIARVASLVAAVSRNQRDTPALYAVLLWELSKAVRGQEGQSDENSPYSPIISSQTKEFVRLLLQSSTWESVVFPGLNGANVESLESSTAAGREKWHLY